MHHLLFARTAYHVGHNEILHQTCAVSSNALALCFMSPLEFLLATEQEIH